MKKIILFLFLAAAQTAMSAESKYDPYTLAKEHNTEYTKYLKTLFDQAKPLPVEKAAVVPRLKKGLSGYGFRSEIKAQTKDNGVNFAGEWTLVVVGCGTACNQYFLVQSKTGKVVDPHLMSTNGNPLFVKDKNILVTGGSVEASTLDEAKNGAWGGPKAWQWNGKVFAEVKL